MTTSQITLSAVLILILVLFAWGKWRHDLVAVFALVICVVLGLIPVDAAFTGFGHPAGQLKGSVPFIPHS